MDNLSVCAACGKKRGTLNSTNWGRHLKKCNNKKKIKTTQISSFFKVESSFNTSK